MSRQSSSRQSLFPHALLLLLVPSTCFFLLSMTEAGHGLESLPLSGGTPLARITVDAGRYDRIDTPLSVSLDGITVPLDEGLCLYEITPGREITAAGEVTSAGMVPVPSQVEPGIAPRLSWILSGKTAAGSVRTYLLEKSAPPDASPEDVVRTVDDGRHVDLFAGGHRVLRYNHAPVPPPEGADPLFVRSGFIHPLWSPAGAELTRIHPADHVHHVGLWNPYAKTKFEGRTVDFWNLGKGKGTVRFVRFLSRVGGPVFGCFRALHEHVDLSAPGGEKVALDEEWDVRVWKAWGEEARSFLVDFTSILRCASKSPVVLSKYRYGGFGFRAARSFDKGDYLTSEGKTRKDGQGTRARWCRVAGPTAEGPAGVLFMSHPQNHAHPEPMRIWSHTAPIFFSFCPIQGADWTLEPGTEYVLRYRMLVYDGTLSAGEAERAWADFGRPPAVRLTVVLFCPEEEKK